MLNFINIDRATPNKRNVLERLKDYDEVYEVFGRNKSKEQAERCMQCGDPYCHSKCPLHNFIPAWLKQRAEDNLELAFLLSNEPSPFPEILGKICPHDVLCEGACSLNTGHGAVAIGAVEAHINEKAFAAGMKPNFPGVTSKKKWQSLVQDLLEFQQQLSFYEMELRLKCLNDLIEQVDF